MSDEYIYCCHTVARYVDLPKADCKCKTNVHVKVECDDRSGRRETAAFRAVNDAVQRMEAAREFYKVLFQNEQFDIGKIYDANESTFIPRKDGVYYVAGTVTFFPDDDSIPYRVRLEIRVNGTSVAADNDFFSSINELLVGNTINVSTVLQLQKGDLVEIYVTSTTPGAISENNPSFSTRFEAAKYR
ncbi:hypothetical protein FIU87_19055 [Bacillus sp. THAF10]|uniref:C1q-like domain-containing protein n=1 Tax=Bacillus sp. THAF10 TaxID=2587848 RepID=UPI0012685007|nr:hypothetical protein [Bacillus sp. THAF10]QFT90747.1 hypothetical protein FIU87_19055 [Bacillus sp. THAF10]